jgi:hypothetical protein
MILPYVDHFGASIFFQFPRIFSSFRTDLLNFGISSFAKNRHSLQFNQKVQENPPTISPHTKKIALFRLKDVAKDMGKNGILGISVYAYSFRSWDWFAKILQVLDFPIGIHYCSTRYALSSGGDKHFSTLDLIRKRDARSLTSAGCSKLFSCMSAYLIPQADLFRIRKRRCISSSGDCTHLLIMTPLYLKCS